MRQALRVDDTCISSDRLYTKRTGRFVFIAASVAIGSTMTSTLPPKPPPTVPPTKWSRLPGTCRMIAVLSRLK